MEEVFNSCQRGAGQEALLAPGPQGLGYNYFMVCQCIRI